MNEDPKYGAWTESNILDAALLAQKIAAGADVNRAMSAASGRFPLAVAAGHGNAQACRLLLTAGANPNIASPPSTSPLCEVIEKRQLARLRKEPEMPVEAMREVFSVLVAHGTNPNGHKKPDYEQKSYESPLYQAATAGDHDAVKELVRLGADIDRKLEHTAVDADFSRIHEFVSTLRLLRYLGASAGGFLLGDQDMMVTFLRLGADDACLGNLWGDRNGFQWSVMIGRDKLVEYYIKERGEDLAQRVDGRTLLQIAGRASTRGLIRSLKTELAVRGSVDGQVEGAKPDVAVKKSRSMVL